MKTFAALAVGVSLLGLTGLAYAAQTITAAPLWSGISTAGACYVRNVGPVPISLTASVYQSSNFGITPSFQNCNQQPLPAGRTCVVLVNDLPDDVTFGCSVTSASSAKYLRATMEVRKITTSGLKVTTSQELR